MKMSAEEFLKEAGLDEAMAPGQIKYRTHVGEKPGTSYTMVYDWKTDPNKIRIEMRPGLTGHMPEKKDLSKYAVWLQSKNYFELDFLAAEKHGTTH
ncbi:MAG: hypothetical protein H6865_01565 [Rhodospirillales bacterium]|nr:hypothetical protein [Alphaproteobacteria bacterium]MCB9986306.1 hypothetical protein [Rhodospirillales bacterium]USO07141.1 MAG: hypothetical protein H6866_06820 [Rhodospirillales bacterium]